MTEDEWHEWKQWYKKSLREWKEKYRKSLQDWKHQYRQWKAQAQIGTTTKTLKHAVRIAMPLPPIPPIPPLHSGSIGRVNVVASRLGDEELRLIDMIIEAGIFSTRSEAVAYLVAEGIKARQDVFDKVSSGLSELRSIRKKAEEQVEKLKEEIGLAKPEDEEASEERFCSECGKELSLLPDDITACPYCGAKLKKEKEIPIVSEDEE
ncbi:MAG: hypothetical protein JSV58_03635 [Candidatus Bathyarchaeota archaeon]|nr:MAG: hypothetical protein JSV58_03635 [Candidatus Bathyarchaeota archaeon]